MNLLSIGTQPGYQPTVKRPATPQPSPISARPVLQRDTLNIRFGQTQAPNWDALSKQYPFLIDTFKKLVEIPTPTPNPGAFSPANLKAAQANLEKIQDVVSQEFQAMGVASENIQRNEGSLLIKIPGTGIHKDKQPLLLMGHLDIVPADNNDPTRAIHPQIKQEDGKTYITSDGTTTLGADNKAGVTVMMSAIARLLGEHPQQQTPLEHGPIELLLSLDEEISCPSFRTLPTDKLLQGKEIVCVDDETAFQITTSLASGVYVDINISGLKGGHSGIEAQHVSANDILADLQTRLNKGRKGQIIQSDPKTGAPVISMNSVIRGADQPKNAIAQKAGVLYFMRSNDEALENKQLKKMKRVVANLEKKYKTRYPDAQNLKIDVGITKTGFAWNADPNSPLFKASQEAAKQILGRDVPLNPCHAGAQPSMIADKTNARGERLNSGILIAPATLQGIHTTAERIDITTMPQSEQWLVNIIQKYFQSAP